MRLRNFIYCFAFSVLFSLFITVRAQTVPGTAFPVAGDVFTLIQADTVGVAPGADGSGITWDFSSLVASGTTQVDSFLTPAATPYGALFPAATIVQHDILPGTNYFIYYTNNTTGSVYERIANVQPDTVIYTTPAGEFPYPLTSSSVFSGSYYAHYNTNGGTATEAGMISGSVDATGTLILPTGTYANVIRAHSTRRENDTVSVSAGTFPIVQTFDYYDWYQPNSYYPILSIATAATTSSVVNRYSKTVGYRAGYSQPSGISSIAADAGAAILFPNPAVSTTHIIYNMAQPGEALIKIYDLTGRLLDTMVNTSAAGIQSLHIDLSILPVGMYEVRVSSPGGSTFARLQVVR